MTAYTDRGYRKSRTGDFQASLLLCYHPHHELRAGSCLDSADPEIDRRADPAVPLSPFGHGLGPAGTPTRLRYRLAQPERVGQGETAPITGTLRLPELCHGLSLAGPG